MSFLNNAEQEYLLKLARKTIENRLGIKNTEIVEPDSGILYQRRGVFVTLHKSGALRGCIGFPLPHKPLKQAVRESAIAAAFEDPRFPALNAGEIDLIDIEISVLTVPEKIDDFSKLEPGKHGIIVSRGVSRGLLLPQVATEQGWTREEFISYGCLKAGLAADAWKQGIELEIFQAQVFNEITGEEKKGTHGKL